MHMHLPSLLTLKLFLTQSEPHTRTGSTNAIARTGIVPALAIAMTEVMIDDFYVKMTLDQLQINSTLT